MDQLDWAAGRTKAADHHGCAIWNIGYGFGGRRTLLVDQFELPKTIGYLIGNLDESLGVFPQCFDSVDAALCIVL